MSVNICEAERTSKKIDCRAIWIHSYLRDCCWCRRRRHHRRRRCHCCCCFCRCWRWFFWLFHTINDWYTCVPRSHSYLIAKLKRIISLTTHTHTLAHTLTFPFVIPLRSFFFVFSFTLSIYLKLYICIIIIPQYNGYTHKKYFVCFWIGMEQRSISIDVYICNTHACCSCCCCSFVEVQTTKIDWKYSCAFYVSLLCRHRLTRWFLCVAWDVSQIKNV